MENKETKERIRLNKTIPQVKKALIYANLAFLLADVANGYMMEAEYELKTIGLSMKRNEKYRFKQAAEQAKRLKEMLKCIANEIYEIKDTESALKDSDYFYKLLLLIVDRVGANKNTSQILESTIFNMKSELNLF